MNWKLNAAAAELAMDPRTLRRKLTETGADATKKAFSTLEIAKAAFHVADLKAEKVRETRARADLLALDLKERAGEMMSTADVQALIAAWSQPIRQRLNSAVSELKHRCNPSDPELAGSVIREWVSRTLRGIQSDIAGSESANPTFIPENSARKGRAH